jgi:ABC-type branched-subunit amino acid transport system ATPase component
MTPMLAMRDVSAGYVAGIDILRGVTINVEPGAITGLIGLNGAGKSTIMKTICGFLRPNKGTIQFDSTDIGAIAAHQVIDQGICYIPQESSLFPFMSVQDNLRLPLDHMERRGKGLPRQESAARLEDMFAKFPVLRERRSARAGDLSGGQQKMVEFAKAYLQRPRFCLIDEPSIGLSPKIAEEVYGWIDLFAAQHMAILLVDHNVRRVVRMSHYIYVLSLGKVAAEGPPEAFAGNLHEQVKGWLGINF